MTRLLRAAGIMCVLLVACATDAATTFANATPGSLSAAGWVTDGTVFSVARSGEGSLYVGGTFSYVGPNTGTAVALSAEGEARHAPLVNGMVRSVVGDGAGGWYVGGTFTQVGASPRANLAHILPDGTVDPAFKPEPNGNVSSLVVDGSILYVGGAFTTIGGQSRARLAALDANGAPTTWNPGADSGVSALALSGSTLYAGGTFTSIGGQPRARLAAIETSDGTPTAWNPGANNTVLTLSVTGSTVYAGGMFTTAGGEPRVRVAAIGAASGTPTSWNPGASATVHALAGDGSTVYLGGEFGEVGGQPRARLAAVDADGAVTGWNPDANMAVYGLSLSGSTVYAAGAFTSVGGQRRDRVAAIGRDGALTDWNPRVNAAARAVAASPDGIYVGGSFSSAGGQSRANAAEIDLTTGRATSWAPEPNGTVGTLAVLGETVYAGGSFTTIGGQQRSSLAALDRAGAATSFNPSPNGTVSRIATSGTTVYVGGGFSIVAGHARGGLASFDASGAITHWSPSADGAVTALDIDGPLVYAGGSFSSIGGQSRARIAALDASGGATAWNPGANGPVYDIDVAGDTVYVAGGFSTLGGQPRAYLGAVDAAGAVTGFDPRPSSIVNAVMVSGSTIYAGGGFSILGGQPRKFIGAVDQQGVATSWNPNGNNTVRSLVVSGATVYAGGSFSSLANMSLGGLGLFVARPITTSPPVLSGRAGVGHTVTASNGGWDNDPAAFSYEWLRDGAVVGGATTRTYGLSADDAGARISARVTARNLGGEATAESASVLVSPPPANTGRPHVKGSPRHGDTLSADAGTWSGGTPLTYTYQWRRCDTAGDGCSDISGATGDTYRATAADVGSTVRVAVTAENVAGTESVPSLARDRVAAETCAGDQSCAAAAPVCTPNTAPVDSTGGDATTLKREGDALVVDGDEVDTAISDNPANGVLLESKETSLCLKPVAPSAESSPAHLVDDETVRFANTSKDADTTIKAEENGIETFTNIKTDEASEQFSWKLDLEGDQKLVKQADGSVDVVDPTPDRVDPGPRPNEAPVPAAEVDELKAAGEVPAGAEPAALDGVESVPEATARIDELGTKGVTAPGEPAPPTPGAIADDLERQADAEPDEAGIAPSGQQPADAPPAPAPTTEEQNESVEKVAAGAVAAPPGAPEQPVPKPLEELAHDTVADAEAKNDAADATIDAKTERLEAAETAEADVVATIGTPWAKDADGDVVDTQLVVSGDTVTLEVDHRQADVAYPVTADPFVTIRRSQTVWDRYLATRYETRYSHHEERRQLVRVDVRWHKYETLERVYVEHRWSWNVWRWVAVFRYVWVPHWFATYHNVYHYYWVPVYRTVAVPYWQPYQRIIQWDEEVYVPSPDDDPYITDEFDPTFAETFGYGLRYGFDEDTGVEPVPDDDEGEDSMPLAERESLAGQAFTTLASSGAKGYANQMVAMKLCRGDVRFYKWARQEEEAPGNFEKGDGIAPLQSGPAGRYPRPQNSWVRVGMIWGNWVMAQTVPTSDPRGSMVWRGYIQKSAVDCPMNARAWGKEYTTAVTNNPKLIGRRIIRYHGHDEKPPAANKLRIVHGKDKAPAAIRDHAQGKSIGLLWPGDRFHVIRRWRGKKPYFYGWAEGHQRQLGYIAVCAVHRANVAQSAWPRCP